MIAYKKNLSTLVVSLSVTLYIVEALLGFYFTTSFTLHPISAGYQHHHLTSEYDVWYKYNNLSLRGADFVADTSYDVTFLGDSFLFGVGVPEEKSVYAGVVNAGFEVLNLSEYATNPHHYLIKSKIIATKYLKTKALVIGLFVGNNFQNYENVDNLTEFINYQYSSDFLEYTMSSFLTLLRLRYFCYAATSKIISPDSLLIHRYEKSRSSYTDWITWYSQNNLEEIEKMRAPRYQSVSGDQEYLRKSEISNSSIEKVAEIINAIGNLDLSDSVILLLIPDRHYVSGELSDAYDKSLKYFLDLLDAKIEILDLHGKIGIEEYYVNDGHWNEQGNLVVTQKLVSLLKKLNPHLPK